MVERVVLRVEGMMCQKNCGTTVQNALGSVAGVSRVVVRFDAGAALVEGTSSASELIEAVEMVGFDAEQVHDAELEATLEKYLPSNCIVLHIEGMMCQKNCGTTITNALSRVAGAEQVIVQHKLHAALVKGSVKAEDLIEAVEMVGFDAYQVSDKSERLRLQRELLEIASAETTVLKIEGMMCQKNCGKTVTNALKNTAGVERVIVCFPLAAALVQGSAPADVLVESVEMVGFDAVVVNDNTQKDRLMKGLEEFGKTQHHIDSSCKSKESSDSDSSSNSSGQEASPFLKSGASESYIEIPLESLTEPKHPEAGVTSNRRRAEIGISGMTCAACVSNVERNLPNVEGVYSVAVALIAEKASIEYDSAVIDGEELARAIDSLGYKGTLIEDNLPCDTATQGVGVLNLIIRNLSGSDVESRLLRPLNQMDGVLAASFNPETAILKVRHQNDTVGARDLFFFVQKAGFLCELAALDNHDDSKGDMSTYYRRMFLGSLIFTIPVVFLSMICPHIPAMMMHLSQPTVLNISWQAFLLWVLSTPVQFYFGWRFFVNAYKALSHGNANMDVLVVLGTSSAYLYSMLSLIVAMFRHDKTEDASSDAHFFETSAMLITFILLGKYLESAARSRTAGALHALMDLQVDTAILCQQVEMENKALGDSSGTNPASPQASADKYGGELVIDLRLVQVGDILKVLPGHRVPVDGVVVTGSSAVDESMLTGEPVPVKKEAGSSVTGCTVNGHGMFYMRATRVGSDTALAQIMKLVEDAQASKAPIQEYADRISQYFVPFVVALAVLTWVVWFVLVFYVKPSYLKELKLSDQIVFAFKFGVAVLVISCPCALGLATPTAVMVATGVGAQHGILIKGGDSIEAASKVTAVVFDKTGTITKGKPLVSSVLNISHLSEKEMIALIGAAESASEHPVAKAITAYAKKFNSSGTVAPPKEFEALPGLGIDCTLEDGSRILVGNRKLMKLNKVEISPVLQKFMKDNEEQGTVVLAALAVGSELTPIGAIAVCDPVNENASYVVSVLRTMKIKVYMLSGDNEVTANAVARSVGIPPECVFANCLPKQKSNRIAKLQKTDVVAMVGDGVNDAAALTLADLGVGVGSGTEIAIKSADVVLIRSNLMDIPVLIDLCKRAITRIKLNFFFSFAYNSLCIPLAAGLMYPAFHLRLPPALAGLLMAMSSVTVVCSSLLLKYYRPPQMMDVEFETKKPRLSLSLDEDEDEESGRVVSAKHFFSFTKKKRGYDHLATSV